MVAVTGGEISGKFRETSGNVRGQAGGWVQSWSLWLQFLLTSLGSTGTWIHPWWEYPHPSSVVWEQSCLVSCASVVKSWSRHPCQDCQEISISIISISNLHLHLHSQAQSLCCPSKPSQPDPPKGAGIQISSPGWIPPMGIWWLWFQFSGQL